MNKGIRKTTGPAQSVEEALAELKAGMKKRGQEYRERSLKIHGNICARCGKEFEGAGLRLLTVHHKDQNHDNNPQDGSNWENLCVYCHEAEHSRELLGDFENGSGAGTRQAEEKKSAPMGTFADLLKKASKK